MEDLKNINIKDDIVSNVLQVSRHALCPFRHSATLPHVCVYASGLLVHRETHNKLIMGEIRAFYLRAVWTGSTTLTTSG